MAIISICIGENLLLGIGGTLVITLPDHAASSGLVVAISEQDHKQLQDS